MPHRTLFAAIAFLAFAVPRAAAQGQLLDACSRGNVDVCQALLARPRLDAGRRAAIEFHLAELEKLIVACNAGAAVACETLGQKHPDVPADLRAPKKSQP